MSRRQRHRVTERRRGHAQRPKLRATIPPVLAVAAALAVAAPAAAQSDVAFGPPAPVRSGTNPDAPPIVNPPAPNPIDPSALPVGTSVTGRYCSAAFLCGGAQVTYVPDGSGGFYLGGYVEAGVGTPGLQAQVAVGTNVTIPTETVVQLSFGKTVLSDPAGAYGTGGYGVAGYANFPISPLWTGGPVNPEFSGAFNLPGGAPPTPATTITGPKLSEGATPLPAWWGPSVNWSPTDSSLRPNGEEVRNSPTSGWVAGVGPDFVAGTVQVPWSVHVPANFDAPADGNGFMAIQMPGIYDGMTQTVQVRDMSQVGTYWTQTNQVAGCGAVGMCRATENPDGSVTIFTDTSNVTIYGSSYAAQTGADPSQLGVYTERLIDSAAQPMTSPSATWQGNDLTSMTLSGGTLTASNPLWGYGVTQNSDGVITKSYDNGTTVTYNPNTNITTETTTGGFGGGFGSGFLGAVAGTTETTTWNGNDGTVTKTINGQQTTWDANGAGTTIATDTGITISGPGGPPERPVMDPIAMPGNQSTKPASDQSSNTNTTSNDGNISAPETSSSAQGPVLTPAPDTSSSAQGPVLTPVPGTGETLSAAPADGTPATSLAPATAPARPLDAPVDKSSGSGQQPGDAGAGPGGQGSGKASGQDAPSGSGQQPSESGAGSGGQQPGDAGAGPGGQGSGKASGQDAPSGSGQQPGDAGAGSGGQGSGGGFCRASLMVEDRSAADVGQSSGQSCGDPAAQPPDTSPSGVADNPPEVNPPAPASGGPADNPPAPTSAPAPAPVDSAPVDSAPVDGTPPAPPVDSTPPAPPVDSTPPAPPADSRPPADSTPPAPPVDSTPPAPPADSTPPAPPVVDTPPPADSTPPPPPPVVDTPPPPPPPVVDAPPPPPPPVVDTPPPPPPPVVDTPPPPIDLGGGDLGGGDGGGD